MSQGDDTQLGCRDECGAKVADTDAAAHAGWEYLEIQKRWRCPACSRALREIREEGYRLNFEKSVAVATDYFYQPMRTCPCNVKIIGLTHGNVGVITQWNGISDDLQGWAPLPKVPAGGLE